MTDEKEIFTYMPSGIYNVETASSKLKASADDVRDSSDVFEEDSGVVPVGTVPGSSRKFVLFGPDNQLPFNIISMVGCDEVMSQNKLFNVLTCYGSGLQYMGVQTNKPTTDKTIKRWMMHSNVPSFMLEQATDMKYFFFTVAVLLLSRDGSQINRIIHKEACFCRFEQANDKGRIERVYYANWRKSALQPSEIESILLLDERDPLGDLEVRMGRAYGTDGLKRVRTSERKFAVVVRFPTPGNRYYPVPYYTSIFRGDWFDIKRLIGKGKKAKLRNHATVRYQVEVHKDYWSQLCDSENILDPEKRKERINKEKENIKNFISGIENSGKVWISGYYIDPNGKETRMVRINVIDTSKEGGDWSEDIEEASNITCYGDNVHPNLVGAVPGKSQSNNSGSDKRELFTLKQSIERAFHDLMNTVHNVVIYYNGWEDKVYPDVPIIMLTTLDQNTDAKKVTTNINNHDDNK